VLPSAAIAPRPTPSSERRGVAAGHIERPLRFAGETDEVPFGLENLEIATRKRRRRAGHPRRFASRPVTTTLALNKIFHQFEGGRKQLAPSTPQILKNVQIELPPGLVGNLSGQEEAPAVAATWISRPTTNATSGTHVRRKRRSARPSSASTNAGDGQPDRHGARLQPRARTGRTRAVRVHRAQRPDHPRDRNRRQTAARWWQRCATPPRTRRS